MILYYLISNKMCCYYERIYVIYNFVSYPKRAVKKNGCFLKICFDRDYGAKNTILTWFVTALTSIHPPYKIYYNKRFLLGSVWQSFGNFTLLTFFLFNCNKTHLLTNMFFIAWGNLRWNIRLDGSADGCRLITIKGKISQLKSKL